MGYFFCIQAGDRPGICFISKEFGFVVKWYADGGFAVLRPDGTVEITKTQDTYYISSPEFDDVCAQLPIEAIFGDIAAVAVTADTLARQL